MRSFFVHLFLSIIPFGAYSQVAVEGYVYESGNRGYIEDAVVSVTKEDAKTVLFKDITDESGIYNLSLADEGTYTITIQKLPFIDHQEVVELMSSNDQVLYLKHEIKRKPGYIFEITLAEKDQDPNAARKGLYDTRVEVYNNTLKEDHLVIDNLNQPEFKVNFLKGNHYTILIRKEGYLSKRMEAFVDVEGCILCFEGIGEVTPGVADNLSEQNTIGVLLANVEMDRYFEGKVIGLNDIYYDLDKSEVTKKGAEELDKIAGFLIDNPELSIELGAHTDSRGKEQYNLRLSQERAAAAVKYLVEKKSVSKKRIFAQGYGESLLTNHCGNGTNCSEEEHAKNRRTELKILKVQDPQEIRTLRQLKADELFEEIIQEISEQEQIVVPQDVDLNEYLAAQNSLATKEKSKVDMNYSDDQVKQDEQELPTKDNPAIANDAMHENSTVTFKNQHSLANASDEPMKKSNSVLDATRYSAFYSGYKIVLHFSRFAIPNDHPLFQKFPKLDIYTTADGNKLYMIESYKTKKEAELRMKKKYQSSFPNAYVMGFENGIITD